MPSINTVLSGQTNDGNDYTEFSVVGIKDRVVVQESTYGDWYVYRVAPGKNGLVKTIGNRFENWHDADLFARGYIAGMQP